jgi:hypothetical protein
LSPGFIPFAAIPDGAWAAFCREQSVKFHYYRSQSTFMSISDNSRQNLLVTSAVLAGLTPLVPIPFVDDHLYAYFMRSMVQRLGAAHSRPFSTEELEALTAQPGRGGALRLLGSVALYPAKKVLRKVFFFLELKRAVDTISHTYHRGFLLDAALDEGWLNAHGAPRVRAAIDAVLARTNTSPVAHAIYGVLNQSQGVLKNMVATLTGSLTGSKAAPGRDKVAQAAASVEEEQKSKMGGLTSQLQTALAGLPDEHFEKLKQQLVAELARS